MDVVVDLATAIICFSSKCYPALVGQDTPRGEFQLTQYTTNISGYGGDVLAFKIENGSVFAIHRVLDIPGQQRLARLRIPYPQYRITITAGCVNVDPEVYDKLVDCCLTSKVIIK